MYAFDLNGVNLGHVYGICSCASQCFFHIALRYIHVHQTFSLANIRFRYHQSSRLHLRIADLHRAEHLLCNSSIQGTFTGPTDDCICTCDIDMLQGQLDCIPLTSHKLGQHGSITQKLNTRRVSKEKPRGKFSFINLPTASPRPTGQAAVLAKCFPPALGVAGDILNCCQKHSPNLAKCRY